MNRITTGIQTSVDDHLPFIRVHTDAFHSERQTTNNDDFCHVYDGCGLPHLRLSASGRKNECFV